MVKTMKQKTITMILIILIVISIFSVIYFNVLLPNQNINNNIIPYVENSNKLNVQKNEQNKTKCIASFTTEIKYPDENRTHNILNACNYLNNCNISKGEIFSFNEVLGPFSEEQGYVQSTGFDAEGKIIKIIGGGICQVSTTLYNAALIANFEIIERNEHSAPVDYVPQGKDATICYPYVDLKFKNTYGSDVFLKAKCDSKTVTIELYADN